MTYAPPRLSPDASPTARAIHQFLTSRQISMRSITRKAGLSPNILAGLFAGTSRSLTGENLEKLASVVGMTGSELLRAGEFSAQLSANTPIPAHVVADAVRAWATSTRLLNPDLATDGIMRFLAKTLAECDDLS